MDQKFWYSKKYLRFIINQKNKVGNNIGKYIKCVAATDFLNTYMYLHWISEIKTPLAISVSFIKKKTKNYSDVFIHKNWNDYTHYI